MIKLESDVLVIGGGITGGFAAIKAHDSGASVAVADKGTIGRSGQSPYVDSHLVFNPDWGDDLKAWLDQVAHVGEYVAHTVAHEPVETVFLHRQQVRHFENFVK